MPRLNRQLRRAAPTLTLLMAVALGGVSLWQAWRIISHLREEARTTSSIFGTVVAALNDPTVEGQTERLTALVEDIRETGIPLIVTNADGEVSACANLALEPDPCAPGGNDPRVLGLTRTLDLDNTPVPGPDGSLVHFGSATRSSDLTLLTLFQLTVLAVAVATAIWAYRTAASLHRDRLWVAMARESAHQLGTPLMSAAAWIERLRDPDPDAKQVARHLRADMDRLERVAARFERIGRPARQEKVGVGSVAARVVNYFQPRLPRHANRVSLTVDAPSAGPMVMGDPVLLEWAVEALVRNSIDALSGRGGEIRVRVRREAESVLLEVQDDGPGIGMDVRTNLFEPGVTTKSGGWGIGLALANRIVEDVHGGVLSFVPVEKGACFVARLPADLS